MIRIDLDAISFASTRRASYEAMKYEVLFSRLSSSDPWINLDLIYRGPVYFYMGSCVNKFFVITSISIS